jgi:glycerophosphoryl diester phosphodiesterase
MNPAFIKKCIAHRALCRTGLVENSYGAIKECAAKSIPIEVDLQFHPGGEIYVFHDESLDRMFKYKINLCDCPVENLGLLKYSDGSRILTLSELLEVVDGEVLILIELKAAKSLSFKNKKRFCELLLVHLNQYAGDVYIQSFNPIILNILRKMKTKFPLGALVCDWNKVGGLNILERKFLQSQVSLLINKVDFISMDADLISTKTFSTLSYLKLKPIFLWTIKSNYQKFLQKRGVTKIIAENFYENN